MIIVIVGGGVVGLNCALALAEYRKSDDIFVLEAEEYLGEHASTRNSEVLHAGFAYPPKSLKSELCIEGNRLSYELLDRLNVPKKRCGKWIVAFTQEEENGLELALTNAAACGVRGILRKRPSDVAKVMPWLREVRAAVFSETSGILDTSEYIRALDRHLSNTPNCQILKRCRVNSIFTPPRCEIYTAGVCHGRQSVDVSKCSINTTRGPMQFDILINSAGLFADEVYRMAGGVRYFEIRPFKGEYYIWRKGPIEGLVYPVPERFISKPVRPEPVEGRTIHASTSSARTERMSTDATLISSMGIHLHRSISGDRYIGPSQIELPKDRKTDYKIETPPEFFAKSASHYLKVAPKAEELEPSQAGNRPKLFEDGKAIGDFVILKEGPIIHLLGIESPGLTAAPAIARKVASMIHN